MAKTLIVDNIYESVRAQFARDICEVMKEQELTDLDVAKRMHITCKKLRRMIWEYNLTFQQMICLINALGGTFRPFIVVASWPPSVQKNPKKRAISDILTDKESEDE